MDDEEFIHYQQMVALKNKESTISSFTLNMYGSFPGVKAGMDKMTEFQASCLDRPVAENTSFSQMCAAGMTQHPLAGGLGYATGNIMLYAVGANLIKGCSIVRSS